MLEFSSTIVSLFQKRGTAPDQGGLLTGKDPSSFNASDPLRLWIIQVGVIVMTTQLLALGLRRMRQPKVIAEVIGGILLGPTAFGRIPGFTDHIFPSQSLPYLSLVANIGLCLFLFLVGLEIDATIIKRNARLSAMVALAGMVIPFGFGAALSTPLYHTFIGPDVVFTHFMLFTGVAYSITAFPVLCRILTELKLLDTTVGIVVLSAGVGNDIVGWTLLALSVALVNAGSGLTALWILLVCVGWILLLLFPVKMLMTWLARKTGSIENGPTMFFMTVTLLLVFGSAFFTDVIGVHAIFGAFLAGIIVPREGGLAIAMTEKMEDMVSIIFLPLYFTLSGLSTNLGLLDNGITWAYTVAICSLAFTGKFGGCTLAARYAAGFSWRESSTIGSLMSCKGLVELIVLNVGLSAGILTQRVFSMFVLEALVLTFLTTPLVTLLYPSEKRVRASATGNNFNNVPDGEGTAERGSIDNDGQKTRFTVVLDKIDHLPAMMALTQLIHRSPWSTLESNGRSSSPLLRRSSGYSAKIPDIFIDAFRLIELSDRVSAVMKSSASDSLVQTDPLLGIFRMFGQLNDLPISTSLSFVQLDDLALSVAEHARDTETEMIMIPWIPPSSAPPDRAHGTPALSNTNSPRPPHIHNPFEALMKTTSMAAMDKSASVLHTHFVRGVFSQSPVDVALFVDQCTVGAQSGSHHHIFFPFFGGPDDRLALKFVVQICANNPKVTAAVVRVIRRDLDVNVTSMSAAHLGDEKVNEEVNRLTVASGGAGFPDTVYGNANTETRLQSETADNIIWAKYAVTSTSDRASTSSSATSRIEFSELITPLPLHAVLQNAQSHIDARQRARTLVVTGRSRRLAVESHELELKLLMDEHGNIGSEVRKTIGDVATAFVVARRGCGVIVLQKSNAELD